MESSSSATGQGAQETRRLPEPEKVLVHLNESSSGYVTNGLNLMVTRSIRFCTGVKLHDGLRGVLAHAHLSNCRRCSR